jgi:hypothetical protein
MKLDLVEHLNRQQNFSFNTFGPPNGTDGVLDHIAKELIEIEDSTEPAEQLFEWIDIVILALDGALRTGFSPEQIAAALVEKQTINENRKWPDWRTAEPGKAIEHIKEEK